MPDAPHIRNAFIEPLRSVFLVDDRFPRYEQLLAQEPREGDDKELAEQVVSFFRRHRLICDIENRAKEVMGEAIGRLSNSDLLVLDYHLRPQDENDATDAHKIIAHLADSPRANLIVVYTRADLEQARRQVAGYLRGVVQIEAEPHEEALMDWKFEPSKQLVTLYLQADSKWKGLIAQDRKELSNLGIPGRDQVDVIARAMERHLQFQQQDNETTRTVELSAVDAPCHWVHSHNAFVAFVSKNDEDILNKLEEALNAWNPPILKVLLAQALAQLDSGGFAVQDKILSDPDTHVAWIYHAISGEEPSAEKRLEQLFARLLSGLSGKLVNDLSEQGKALLASVLEDLPTEASSQDRMKRARKLARDFRNSQDEAILHALNVFLCSEEYRGSHVKTGTIFRSRKIGSEKDWDWWCVLSPRVT